MPIRVRVWLLTTATFLLFALLAWALGRIAGDSVTGLNTYRFAIIALGVLAAGSVYRFLTTRWKGRIRGEKAAAREDHLAAAFRSARKRLAASSRTGKKSLSHLPAVLVLGPRGAAKTTVVVQSGLDPELLAGESHRGEAIVPTEGTNIWFADGLLLVEAAGALMDHPEQWEALLSHTQPARFAAALGVGSQAPRVALVCVGCDEFTQPGATEQTLALARRLRERLLEAAQALGVRLPVHVLFTRADRLPHFDEYVRHLTGDEASRALGVTLPIEPPDDARAAEAEGRRIDGYLETFLRSLSLKRPDFLARERDTGAQAAIYEFPREVERIHEPMRRFLVELCRPSQLGSSPFLRSFHFTGVRALVVDEAPGGTPAPASPTAEPALGATQVFDAERIRAAAAAAAASGPTRSRRIPDWVFLKSFFRRVLADDEKARLTTTGGRRVDGLRRGLLTAVAAVAVVWTIGMVVSFRGNRGIVERVEAVAAGVQAAEVDGSPIPSAATLQALDTLRAELVELRRHATEGRPLGLRWGLYKGDDVVGPGLLVWLRGFERALGLPARHALLDQLAALPDEPSEASEYGRTYDALKAYLILTEHPEESTVAFLPDAMLASWPAARSLDEDRAVLLRRQLDFFAEVIRDGNPVAGAVDAQVVTTARGFLGRFGDADRFYQSMVADAAASGEEVRLATIPGAAGLLAGNAIVPAHFTVGAWDYLRTRLRDLDALFSSEDWVLGAQVVSAADRQQLADDLWARYQEDYAAAWQGFLQDASAAPFGGPADAARRLGGLSDGQSPLLQLLAVAAHHTRPQQDLFQPLHVVAPPEGDEGRLIGEWNQSYVGALATLQGAVDAVASASGPARTGALGQAEQAVRQAEQTVAMIAQGFNGQPDGARVTGSATRTLLESPIRRVGALVGALPSSELNGRGRQFCQDFSQLLQGYPFQAGSPIDAQVDDVIAALQPGQSALWAFYQDALQSLIAPQGNRYVARPGADPAPNPAFVAFFNRAAEASSSLFDDQGAGPQIVFVLRPQTTDDLPEITVSIDGQTQTFTRTQAAARTFIWEADRARDARITGRLGGSVVPLIEVPDGPWALFRLFHLAEWQDLGGSRYQLTWRVPNQSLGFTAELNLAAPAPIFQRSFLDGLACVSTVAR